MKNILFVVFVFVFFIFGSQNALAQTASLSGNIKHVDYTLPYPGILPDSPLYFLKVVRDNLLGFFISESLKKAEYKLLMADKRLTSASALVDKKNYPLAITTLSKAENYFYQAVQNAAKAKEEGKETNGILNKLLIASEKHQEIIYQMVLKTKGDVRYSLELEEVRAKSFQDTVEVVKAN
nr:hypothetical protein [Candidatus Levybacteria bacterium]